MKQRPIKKHFQTGIRTAGVLLLALVLVCTPFTPARADRFDEQINQLMAEAAGYQTEANRLRSEANTLQNEIAAISAQQQSLNTQITAIETQLVEIGNEIENTELRITNVKQALGDNLRSLYIEGDVSPIEMIASSKSIGDYVDKEEARNRINEAIGKNIKKLADLKQSLAQQKQEADATLERQKGMKAELVAQEQQKNTLLSETQGQEAAYQNLVQQNNSKISDVRAQQIASFARVLGSGYRSSGSYGSLQYRNLTVNIPCGGGYDSYLCAASQDTIVDKWRLYNRECVSYVAWAIENRFGKFVPSFNGFGNAEQWPGYLNGRNGIVANETPAAGTAVVIPSEMIGGVGHVAVVESVADGWLHVSQYNWNSPPDGKYSEMDLRVVPGLVFIHFP